MERGRQGGEGEKGNNEVGRGREGVMDANGVLVVIEVDNKVN